MDYRKFAGLIALASMSAIAQPPGLQGPFVPLEVVSVNPTSNETHAVLDYYARTDSGTDLYEREGDTFDKSTMVGLGAEIIGTPWEGATCAALLDAGFDTPCAIPPSLPPPVVPPPYANTINCQRTAFSADSTGGAGTTLPGMPAVATSMTIGACIGIAYDALPFGTLRSPVSTVCIAGGDAIELYVANTRAGYPPTLRVANITAGTASYCANQPAPPLPDPTPPPPTTDEVYDAILPAISKQYFYDYSTQRVVNNNSTINSTSTSITNNYTTYQSQWQTGDPMTPPTTSSTPLPDAPQTPEPLQIDLGPIQVDLTNAPVNCDEYPGSVGCLTEQSFFDGVVATLLGGFNLNQYSDFVMDTVEYGTAMGNVDLVGASACPAAPTVTIMGSVYTFQNAYICDGLAYLYPLIILLSTLSAMYIVVGAFRSQS